MDHIFYLLLIFCSFLPLCTGQFGNLEGFNVSLQEGFYGAVVLRNASKEYITCNSQSNWNYFACKVLCREIGYGGGYFNAEKVNITQDVKEIDLYCEGSEEALMECSDRYVLDTGQCERNSNSNIATCQCNNPDIAGIDSASYQAFLSNGWQGYAYVMYGDTTYSICSDDWGNDDCSILCRENNFNGGRARQRIEIPTYSNSYLSLNIKCAGYDNSIRQCTNDIINQCHRSWVAVCECHEPDTESIVFGSYTLTVKNRVCTNGETEQARVTNLQECKRQCDSNEGCKSFSFQMTTENGNHRCYTTTQNGCTNLLEFSDAFVFRKINGQSQNEADGTGSLGLAFGITVAVVIVLFIVITALILLYYTRRIKELKEPVKNQPTSLSNLETENRIFRNNDNRYSNHSQVNGAKGALPNEPRNGRNSLPKLPSVNGNSDDPVCKDRESNVYDVEEDDCYVTMDAEYDDRVGQIDSQPGADNGLELTTNSVYNADGVPSPPCESETNYAYSYGHFNLEGRKRQE